MRLTSILLVMFIVAGCASESKIVDKAVVDTQSAFFKRCHEVVGDGKCSVNNQIGPSGPSKTLIFGKEVGRDSLWSCSNEVRLEGLSEVQIPPVEFDGVWPKGRPASLGDFKCAYLVCNEEVCQESGDESALKVLRRSARAIDDSRSSRDIGREELDTCLKGSVDAATTMACGGIVSLPKDKVIHYLAKNELAQAKTIFIKNSEQIKSESLQQCSAAAARRKALGAQAFPDKSLLLELESVRCEGGSLTGWALILSEQTAQKKAKVTLAIHGKTKTLVQEQTLVFPVGFGSTRVSRETYKVDKRVNGLYFMTTQVGDGIDSDYNLPMCISYQEKNDEVLISRVGDERVTDCTHGGTSVWKYKIVKDSAKQK